MSDTHARMTAREIAEPRTILRAVVGSTLHGLALEGTDDTDEMAVCVEPPAYVIGLAHFEQWVYRTQPEGHRSGPGDLDLTAYSLRKWARLAANGNPTILLLLFAPPAFCSVRTADGIALQENAHLFVSRRAGHAFLGYLTAQKERLVGTRGGMRSNRPELIAAHGHDVKYAGHLIRLGLQGIELLRTGRLTLPMKPGERSYVLSVRRGEIDLQAVLTRAGELERELKDLLDTSPLPEDADRDAIDHFLIAVYRGAWSREVGSA